ncbi:sporulation integral membrane protein YtvI [Gracilibacillus sp. S3-1-1]|uniref:Sporulation integral membrane protein YtvI n=1 Tax=Gracilibacillus pellucidus TaxID=3095368 RepID=A0ACC6M725_9BACI|nr:sporulation integral membrane protein YtvI [Gracilibacillus sp. S3-1-1]MDX8046696.1 sporulation integral membrane protein YtvI [Gracilibacillus sp. S3-1-1]
MLTKQMTGRILYLLGIVSLFILIIYLIVQFLFPLFLACIIALILYPIIRLMHKHLKIPYVWSCVLALLFAIVGTLITIFYIGFEILQGIIYLTKQLPDNFRFVTEQVLQQFNHWVQPFLQKVNQYIHSLPDEQHLLVEEQLAEISISLADKLAYLLEITLNWIGAQVASLPESITIIIFSLLCTFFICKDWDKFYQYTIKKIPNSYVHLGQTIITQLKTKFMKYLRAQLILISITFCIILVGLTIFQVKHSLTIALLMALVDLIPIIGTGIIFVPWSLYLFMTGETTLAICLFSLYLFVLIQKEILEPKIVSNALGIHPILTILAIYLGFQLFGVKGIWLGPLTLFIIKACSEAQLFHLIWRYIKHNQISVDKS